MLQLFQITRNLHNWQKHFRILGLSSMSIIKPLLYYSILACQLKEVILSRNCKWNVDGNVLICFHFPEVCFFRIWRLYRSDFTFGDSKLLKLKKNLRGKKTWELKICENTRTLSFKSNESWNTETHNTDQNPPITITHHHLFQLWPH